MKTLLIIICIIFFLGGLYSSIKELFTTKKPIAIKNNKVIYQTTGRAWYINFGFFLLIVFILTGIIPIFSYYLK